MAAHHPPVGGYRVRDAGVNVGLTEKVDAGVGAKSIGEQRFVALTADQHYAFAAVKARTEEGDSAGE